MMATFSVGRSPGMLDGLGRGAGASVESHGRANPISREQKCDCSHGRPSRTTKADHSDCRDSTTDSTIGWRLDEEFGVSVRISATLDINPGGSARTRFWSSLRVISPEL